MLITKAIKKCEQVFFWPFWAEGVIMHTLRIRAPSEQAHNRWCQPPRSLPSSPLPITAAYTYLLKGLKCPGYIYTRLCTAPRPYTYLKGHRWPLQSSIRSFGLEKGLPSREKLFLHRNLGLRLRHFDEPYAIRDQSVDRAGDTAGLGQRAARRGEAL